jgi:hypothetical protein
MLERYLESEERELNILVALVLVIYTPLLKLKRQKTSPKKPRNY